MKGLEKGPLFSDRTRTDRNLAQVGYRARPEGNARRFMALDFDDQQTKSWENVNGHAVQVPAPLGWHGELAPFLANHQGLPSVYKSLIR